MKTRNLKVWTTLNVRPFLLAVAAAAMLAQPKLAEAAIIYSDDFSGSSSANLHGTAPDTRPGSQTWTANLPASRWKADGSIIGVDDNASAGQNAVLPFVPTSGKIYTLSADLNQTVDTSHWFALGFLLGGANAASLPFYDQGAPWVLDRGNGEVLSNPRLGTSYGAHGTHAGTTNFKIVLVTHPTLFWTAEWFIDNASVRGPLSYLANPSITHVGISSHRSASGSVDNFLLSESIIPEPASLSIIGLGATLLLRRRSRA